MFGPLKYIGRAALGKNTLYVYIQRTGWFRRKINLKEYLKEWKKKRREIKKSEKEGLSVLRWIKTERESKREKERNSIDCDCNHYWRKKRKNCTIRKEHITHCKPYYVIMRCVRKIINTMPPARAEKLFTCEYSLVFFIILHTRACVCRWAISDDTRRRREWIGCVCTSSFHPSFEE